MTIPPKNKVSFEHSFIVKHEEIDALEHVNNIVYLQWIQNVSALHWNHLASDTIKAQYVWVALRHEIDYISPAFLEDVIRIHTWIDETNGVKSTRIVHVYRENTLVAKSKTVWVLLDAKSKKPKRIGQDILDLFSKD